MNIKLVASDLDGTIIDKNNNISPKNFEAISKLHNKNIEFAICTGKSYSVSKKICEKFDASYGIFGNGTQIINLKTGNEIYRNIISKSDLLFVVTLAKRYSHHIHLYTDEEIISEKLEFMDLRNYILKSKNSNSELKFKIVHNILDYIENNDLSVFSAVISTESTTLQEFQKLLKINSNIDYTFINKRGKFRDMIINKDYEYINVTPTNINKDAALTVLGNFLDIKKSEMMSVGDNLNDLEMVREAGIGVAVNEAYLELKNVAKYITESKVSDGAFAEAINKFIQ